MRRAWLLGLGLLGAASVVLVSVLLLTGGEQLERAGAASGCESGTAVPEPANSPGLVADCETLLALRDDLRGTATLNWSAETSIRRWSGVLISGAPPRVTRIWLWSSSLSGRVPAGLGKLTALTSLDLHDNELSGAIPPELGSLSQLQTLHLNKNKLTGSIPAELEQLSQLQWVTLAGNTLEGCVPPKLRKVRFHDLPQLRLRDCASTPSTATPTPTATATPTATVTPKTYTLTLTASAGGSLSANPAGPSYAKETAVTVTATADDGYKLSSWGDDCSDTLATSTTCSLTMDTDKTVSATFAVVAPSEPLTLIVVSDGSHDSLILEWTGGPANATKWQYRQRRWDDGLPLAWQQWTDIPGSGAATQRHRISGLDSLSGFEYQVRAVVGTTAGAESEADRGGTQKKGSKILDIYLSRVVEGDGRREWQVVNFTIVIPDGMRLHAGVPFASSDGRSGSPVYDVAGGGGLTFSDDGVVLVRYVAPVTSADASVDGNAEAKPPRDVGALLDQIIASVRELD